MLKGWFSRGTRPEWRGIGPSTRTCAKVVAAKVKQKPRVSRLALQVKNTTNRAQKFDPNTFTIILGTRHLEP
jgi:hypothetical protein